MAIEHKPSSNEDEYFLKLDAERIKEMRTKLDGERAQAERKSHYMKCPKCGGTLKETDFQHIKVDICSDCSGIWFDAGEVEMLGFVRGKDAGGFLSGLFKGLSSR